MKKLSIACIGCLLCIKLFAQDIPAAQKIIIPVQFDWAPDGSGLYLTVIRMNADRKGPQSPPEVGIFFVDNSGKSKPVVKNGSGVSVSPDGKQLVFTRSVGDKMGANNELYTFDLESRTEKLLLSDGTRKGDPDFSPDGKQIAYTITTRDESGDPHNALTDIWIYDLASGTTRQLTKNVMGHRSFSPQWDLTGKKILYYQELGDNRDQIYLMDSQGKKNTNLTSDTTTHNFYPSWYGKKILYTQFPDKIMMMNTDGEHRTMIEGLQNPFAARLNAAENKLAYLTKSSRENPGSMLMVFDLDKRVNKILLDNAVLSTFQF